MLTLISTNKLLRFSFVLLSLFLMGDGVWGQTTVNHSFSTTSGTIDPNISFATDKNSGTAAPFNNGSELRLYYDSGGNGDGCSITLTPLNGAVITDVVLEATSTADTTVVKYNEDGRADVTASLSLTTYAITGLSASTSLKLRNANITNEKLWLSTVSVTYSLPSTCTPTTSITSFFPSSGPAETLVTISGSGFTGATQVKFGLTDATSYTIVDNNQIIAEVPFGINANESISVFDAAACQETSNGTFSFITESGNCADYSGFTDLFISEIYDSENLNVWNIELYNPTSCPIVLTNEYQIKRAADILAPTTYSRTIDLIGTVPPNSVFIIAAGDSPQTCSLTYDMTEAGSGVNENDVIALYKNNGLLDVTHAPNEKGYSLLRKIDAGVVAPSSTYIAGDWTVNSEESCDSLGSFNLPTNSIDISSSPSDLTDCSLSLSVSSSTTGVTYQWKYNDPSNMVGWADVNSSNISAGSVSGETTSTLTITGDIFSLMDYQFYCEVSKTGCTSASNAAQFKVESKPIYRSVASANGNWSDYANWEMSIDYINYTAACTYPREKNSTEVIIQNGTRIVYDLTGVEEISIDKVTIDENGTLELSQSSKLTINNSVSGADLIVNGTLLDRTNTSSSLTFSSDVTWELGSNGTIIKSNSGAVSLYRNDYEGGMSAIPSTANWIYRYNEDGNPSVGSIDFFYPNLSFENTSSFPYSWNGVFSSFTGSTGGYATVKGDLIVGANGVSPCIVSNVNSNTQPMLILGNVIVSAGSELINNNSVTGPFGTGFELKGDLTVDGAIRITGTTEERVLRFTGSSDQNVSGAGIINVYKTTVAKPSGSLILNTNYRSQNELVMTQGNIFTNSNILELGKSRTQKGTLNHTDGFVIGKMRRWFDGTNSGNASGLFPMGFDDSGLQNRNTKVEFNTPPSGGGYLTVEYMGTPMTYGGLPIYSSNTNGAGFDVTTAEDQGFWKIENQNGKLTDGTYTISCTGEGYQTVTELSKLTLLKRVVNSSPDWFCPGIHDAPAGSAVVPIVSRSGVTGWSNFGFGGGLGNALPVTLTSFEVKCADNNSCMNINWSTASETNSSHFIVEKSRDMINWSTVFEVQAAGNSSEHIDYTEVDANPWSGISYYRLKQYDFNGALVVFNAISVSCVFDPNQVIAYPNPSNGSFTLEITWNEKRVNTQMQVMDITGKVVHLQNIEIEEGVKQLCFNQIDLQPGTYLIAFPNTELKPIRVLIVK